MSHARVVIVDYGASNLRSIVASIGRITSLSLVISGRDEPPAVHGTRVTNSVSEVKTFEPTHIILPGVGSFATAMQCLTRSELLQTIKDFHTNGLPILGICLGMQMLFESGEEGTSDPYPGIGLIPGTVQNLRKLDVHAKYVPNIGWSSGFTEFLLENDKIVPFSDDALYFYCHEYGVLADRYQTTDIKYVLELPGNQNSVRILSGFVSKNLTGVQFHPERSGIAGENFLKSWIMNTEFRNREGRLAADFESAHIEANRQ